MKIGVHLMLELLLAGSGWANSIQIRTTIYDPPNNIVQLNTDFTNDDSGAVYDSYETSIFSNLVTNLWGLSHNQSTYSNQIDMLNDWSMIVSPEGDVYGNWTHDGNYADLNITHGFIGGYDSWTTDSASDMMRLTLNIPLSQLDGDGDGWSAEDPMDFQIGLGAEASEMGVASAGIDSWYAAAEPYEAVLNPQATSNGTSILWLEGYGVTNDFEAASVGNPDGDRYLTVEEYTLDTNPTNATPAFALSFPGGTNPAVMTFSPSSTGRTYTVWHADGMVDPDWTEGTTCTGSAGSTTITNTLGLGPQYLQLRVNRP